MSAVDSVSAPAQPEPERQDAAGTVLSPLRRALAAWRSWIGQLALGLALAAFFGGLVYVNCFWVCFPTDNDLDEVAWLVQHLSLKRPESFANQGYPPGLPVVLRGLTPVVGSFLRATFLWQSIAATASLFFVTRIAAQLSPRSGAGLLALVCAGLACLPVATSEFADGSSSALFLCGLWLFTRRGADRRGFFLFGLSSGVAYLFRTHYVMLLVLVPAAALGAGFGWRNLAKVGLAFGAGFAATAWPLWLANTLAYGTPLHAGVSQYNIAFSAVSGALDWEDYPNTYARWPLSRILSERPWDLVNNSFDQVFKTFGHKLTLAGMPFGAVALVLVRERVQRQILALGSLLALLYICLVILPTRFTDRAFAPVAMICSVLVACGLAELVRQTRRPRWYLAWALLGVVFVNYPQGMWDRFESRARAARYNERITARLVKNGMRSSDEVFSNVWNVYNMSDPNFVTYYNYGGWIELDSLYARERPHPNAVSVPEWQSFFAEQAIRFAILKRTPKTEQIFRSPPASWRKLLSDRRLSVWAVDPPPDLPAEPAPASATSDG